MKQNNNMAKHLERQSKYITTQTNPDLRKKMETISLELIKRNDTVYRALENK
ncbi:hypothetical protein [Veillonella intestinalis]|uniref:hypothetical protein n=1 Tax=Veillonella intestinalis TaxID=2941341 RepID=UPI00203BBE02|nr:hypothetical protein [Veillonella intestinalis]